MSCKCISCGLCDGRGSYVVDMRGNYVGLYRRDDLDSFEICEECGGSGISETCDECSMDMEMCDDH